jgi:hypothetical protein
MQNTLFLMNNVMAHLGQMYNNIFPANNRLGLKLKGTHQLLAYADDLNLLGDIKNTIKRNTQTLIDASN